MTSNPEGDGQELESGNARLTLALMVLIGAYLSVLTVGIVGALAYAAWGPYGADPTHDCSCCS